MSTHSTLRARRRGPSSTGLALGVVLLALLGGALLLHASGVIDIPLLSGKRQEVAVIPRIDMTGKVIVPISSQVIPAYSAVAREHLIDRRTNTFSTYVMREDRLPKGALLSNMDILTRVLKRDKPNGMMFVESDFYPKGTRPGPTAGVPSGMRALRLRASAVPGLHGLQQGDRFDIVMTTEVEIEEQRAPSRSAGRPRLDFDGPYASLLKADLNAPEPRPAPVVKRRYAEVHVVVENGLVVQPVHKREETRLTATLLRGAKREVKPVEELIIAIAPKEVSALNHALAVEAMLQVAMRSGQAEDPKAPADQGKIPDLVVDPMVVRPEPPKVTEPKETKPRLHLMEVIIGGKKELVPVPTGK